MDKLLMEFNVINTTTRVSDIGSFPNTANNTDGMMRLTQCNLIITLMIIMIYFLPIRNLL